MKVRIEELFFDPITQTSEWTSVYEVETEHNCDVQEELEFFLELRAKFIIPVRLIVEQ